MEKLTLNLLKLNEAFKAPWGPRKVSVPTMLTNCMMVEAIKWISSGHHGE